MSGLPQRATVAPPVGDSHGLLPADFRSVQVGIAEVEGIGAGNHIDDRGTCDPLVGQQPGSGSPQ